MEKGLSKQLFLVVALALFCSNKIFAEVILPFGQKTKQPWNASCFYAPIDGDKPADNWYATDFDDSEWATLEGPISTDGGIAYYATPWTANYSAYWVRRHFKINDVNKYLFANLYIHHDDDCEIYLNGELIYKESYYNSNLITVTMTEEMRSHFVEGDNIIAARVSDTGGGEAYMDFGIYLDEQLMSRRE